MVRLYSRAVAISAEVSFPKHEPPQPIPACRNRVPMRASRPMPLLICVASAPTFSASCATSLMKLILRARKALAAYFTSSADARLVVMSGTAPSDSGRGRKLGAGNVCSTTGR